MLTAKSSEVIQFKPKPSNGQHFAMIRDSLQLSPAWQNLPPGPAKLYVAMAGIYNGHNNGRIRLSVRDAAKLVKKSESTVSRWLNHLEKAGLAVRTKRGSFNPHTKTAWSSLWALTEWMSDEERKACSSTCKNESPASPSTCTSESGWTCMDETNLIDKKDNKLRIDKISKIDSSFSESQSQEESGEARGPSAPKEGREESKQVKKASAAPSGAIAPSPASSSSSSLTPPPPVPRAPPPPPAEGVPAAAVMGVIKSAVAGRRIGPAVNSKLFQPAGRSPPASPPDDGRVVLPGDELDWVEDWCLATGRSFFEKDAKGCIKVPYPLWLQHLEWKNLHPEKRGLGPDMRPSLGPGGDSLLDFADYGP
jgi:hypothetical protein